jgi:hypothetical protein
MHVAGLEVLTDRFVKVDFPAENLRLRLEADTRANDSGRVTVVQLRREQQWIHAPFAVIVG